MKETRADRDVTNNLSRNVAATCAVLLFAMGFKILMLNYSRADVPAYYGQPGVGGPAVEPPPGFTPPPLPDGSSTPRGLYPFVGVVPMESVGAAVVLLAVMADAIALSWVGVLVLVVFSAGHTVADWALIVALAMSLIACHFSPRASRA